MYLYRFLMMFIISMMIMIIIFSGYFFCLIIIIIIVTIIKLTEKKRERENTRIRFRIITYNIWVNELWKKIMFVRKTMWKIIIIIITMRHSIVFFLSWLKQYHHHHQTSCWDFKCFSFFQSAIVAVFFFFFSILSFTHSLFLVYTACSLLNEWYPVLFLSYFCFLFFTYNTYGHNHHHHLHCNDLIYYTKKEREKKNTFIKIEKFIWFSIRYWRPLIMIMMMMMIALDEYKYMEKYE